MSPGALLSLETGQSPGIATVSLAHMRDGRRPGPWRAGTSWRRFSKGVFRRHTLYRRPVFRLSASYGPSLSGSVAGRTHSTLKGSLTFAGRRMWLNCAAAGGCGASREEVSPAGAGVKEICGAKWVGKGPVGRPAFPGSADGGVTRRRGGGSGNPAGTVPVVTDGRVHGGRRQRNHGSPGL